MHNKHHSTLSAFLALSFYYLLSTQVLYINRKFLSPRLVGTVFIRSSKFTNATHVRKGVRNSARLFAASLVIMSYCSKSSLGLQLPGAVQLLVYS